MAADDLRARLDAAREVNDPESVLTFRDELAPLLPAEERRELDRDLARWLMHLIQRRLRAGTVRADVAQLAARVADHFGDTPEGASLRAALPTLRRSAGLCARCARPYAGIEDACPQCLAGPATLPFAPPAADEPEEEPQEGPESAPASGDGQSP